MNISGLDDRVLEVRVVSNKHFSDKSRARAAYISEAWRSPSLSMRLGGTLDLGHLDASVTGHLPGLRDTKSDSRLHSGAAPSRNGRVSTVERLATDQFRPLHYQRQRNGRF